MGTKGGLGGKTGSLMPPRCDCDPEQESTRLKATSKGGRLSYFFYSVLSRIGTVSTLL